MIYDRIHFINSSYVIYIGNNEFTESKFTENSKPNSLNFVLPTFNLTDIFSFSVEFFSLSIHIILLFSPFTFKPLAFQNTR